MLFQRFLCEPLAAAGYLLADGDEGVVVDPMRDVDAILELARSRGIRIRWALATHVHADFVAGLGEVAAATGARIGLGERFSGGLGCERLGDGHEIRFGDRRLRVLHTPGHTPESVCFAIEAGGDGGEVPRLLTGDTLFVGDVGRPDLATSPGTHPRDMARMLHASLRERIAPLPDDTEIWPAHGAGSACGSCIASAPSSTLGAERLSNWALGEPDPDAFCARLLQSLRPPPRYFARVAELNRDGPELAAKLAAPPQLTTAAAERALHGGAALLDVREWTRHGRGHWPTALNVGLFGGEFESWAAELLPAGAEVVIHADDAGQAAQAVTRLRRVGIESVAGFVLDGPPGAAQRLPQIDAIDLFAPDGAGKWQVVDVRRPDEFAAGHVPGAVHCELMPAMSPGSLGGLDPTKKTALICEGGYRSSAAVAQLRAAGFTELCNVQDGMRGWRGNHLPTGSS